MMAEMRSKNSKDGYTMRYAGRIENREGMNEFQFSQQEKCNKQQDENER